MRIGLIVEGHGEVHAVPVLVRRIAAWLGYSGELEILPPLRIHRQKLPKEGELERAVEIMARKVGDGGKLLVLLDSDEGCPATLGPALLTRARAQRTDRDAAVVLAKREYEAWFAAAAASLRGQRSLAADVTPPPDAEALPSPKGWLSKRMSNGYSETVDQPALTAVFDLGAARTTASFDKLVRDLARLLGVDSAHSPVS